jgi:hypothetical protein
LRTPSPTAAHLPEAGYSTSSLALPPQPKPQQDTASEVELDLEMDFINTLPASNATPQEVHEWVRFSIEPILTLKKPTSTTLFHSRPPPHFPLPPSKTQADQVTDLSSYLSGSPSITSSSTHPPSPQQTSTPTSRASPSPWNN